MATDTSKVTGRREVHFNNLNELQADAEKAAAGKVRLLGNHSLGQIFKHQAIVMHGSIDGIPVKAPWLIRLLAPFLLKNRLINKGMKPGIRLPPGAEESLWPGEVGTQEGLDALRQAIRRLQTETKREPSPFLGKLTNEEWDKLHLRHGELHMSFVVFE